MAVTALTLFQDTIRYDTRCYFSVRSEADISQFNLPHEPTTKKWRQKQEKPKSKNVKNVIFCSCGSHAKRTLFVRYVIWTYGRIKSKRKTRAEVDWWHSWWLFWPGFNIVGSYDYETCWQQTCWRSAARDASQHVVISSSSSGHHSLAGCTVPRGLCRHVRSCTLYSDSGKISHQHGDARRPETGPFKNVSLYTGWKWRQRVCGHDTIAILWV